MVKTATAALLFFAATASAQVTVTPSGPLQTVFRWATDKCSTDDIPDDGARAFRDSTGLVHLIASHYINWAMTGKDLNHVKKNCTTIYRDSGSPDPQKFDDMGWLESEYTPDGKNVYGLVSMDYHPSRHGLPCASRPGGYDCWYSTIVYASSTDGGYHFTSPPPGAARFIAGSPYQFDPNQPQPAGSFVASNIIERDGAYYAFISESQDRAQKGGSCLMRTETLDRPNSWRAWDGKAFTVQFVDPYVTPVMTAAKHVCEPVSPQLVQAVRSLLALENGKGYIVTMLGGANKPDGRHYKTVLVSTSPDLIHWSPAQVVQEYLDVPVPACRNNPKAPLYGYPALLDPNSKSRNFETVGDAAYIYMTLSHGCGNMNRDLVRLPVKIATAR
jgi:hypothetical protein